jgi:hypothetical protein
MRKICAKKTMPVSSAVYLEMARNEEFRSIIARAREAQQDAEADRIVDMADDATAEDWQVVKLRIWARQWRASKLAPKKYGDRQQLEHTGRDGGPIQTMQIDPERLKGMPDDELAALERAIGRLQRGSDGSSGGAAPEADPDAYLGPETG